MSLGVSSFPSQGARHKTCPTQRAPDGWESARFQAGCVAWSGFRQSGVPPPAPARVTQAVRQAVQDRDKIK